MSDKVPFLDLVAVHEPLAAEMQAAFASFLASGQYMLGPQVEAFERGFADYCGARHCIGVSNGLDALQLILQAFGIGPGDEVLVPANTFIATWLAVSHCGATPVPVEPDPATCNIDPARVEQAITPRTRAIIAVHLYGQTADMPALSAIARRHGLKLIEDAAQAHGARHAGRRAGTLGDAAAFSFYPGKNLGALGDAGAVVTDDSALDEAIRLLRNYGSPRRYVHQRIGFNHRLDELQAALLNIKLPHLDGWNQQRRAQAARYRELLAGVAGVRLPEVLPECEPVWHLFVIRHARRDALLQWLADGGIGALIHYPIAPHRQQAYAERQLSLPISEQMHSEVLSLPIGPHLTLDDIDRVGLQIRRFESA